MKALYKTISFRPASLALIDRCNFIIDEYLEQGLRLTLRQLYYRLVTQNTITNEEKSYKNLGSLVSDGRLAGLIDWDAIEDRGRQPDLPQEFASLRSLIAAAKASYRLPRWKGQPYYAELWVEKQALAGVLEPLARKFHAPLMVNKGYSSQSAMREAALRFIERWENDRQQGVLFYLGDHDPSGEDMVRDIRDRLDLFGADVDVRKVALTMAQIKQHNLVPNPAKLTDSRAQAYIQKYGNSSWEVDALDPAELARIVSRAFSGIIDVDRMAEVTEQEEKDKAKLDKLVGGKA